MNDTDKYTGHTEGPWFDGEPTKISNAISNAFLQLNPNEIGKANARLAVDAPLLLAMLNELLEECRMHYWCYESENDEGVCARCGGNNEHKEWCDL